MTPLLALPMHLLILLVPLIPVHLVVPMHLLVPMLLFGTVAVPIGLAFLCSPLGPAPFDLLSALVSHPSIAHPSIAHPLVSHPALHLPLSAGPGSAPLTSLIPVTWPNSLPWTTLPAPTALGSHRATARLVDVALTPNTSSLPGGQVLQNLMNGLGGWALALALVGLVVGAAAWALGSHGQNYQQSYVGRRAVLISGLAALLIGAGPAIVNFFFHAGQGVH
jgi:Family of unknown function (DUF6112)